MAPVDRGNLALTSALPATSQRHPIVIHPHFNNHFHSSTICRFAHPTYALAAACQNLTHAQRCNVGYDTRQRTDYPTPFRLLAGFNGYRIISLAWPFQKQMHAVSYVVLVFEIFGCPRQPAFDFVLICSHFDPSRPSHFCLATALLYSTTARVPKPGQAKSREADSGARVLYFNA